MVDSVAQKEEFIKVCEKQISEELGVLFDSQEEASVHPDMEATIVNRIKELFLGEDAAVFNKDVMQNENYIGMLARVAALSHIEKELAGDVPAGLTPNEIDGWSGLMRDCLEYLGSPLPDDKNHAIGVPEDLEDRISSAEGTAYSISSVSITGASNNYICE